MPKPFLSTKQYFPPWSDNPILFEGGAVWTPYSMGVHRNNGEVLHENIWLRTGRELQLEFPWGRNYGAIQDGLLLLASITTH